MANQVMLDCHSIGTLFELAVASQKVDLGVCLAVDLNVVHGDRPAAPALQEVALTGSSWRRHAGWPPLGTCA